MLSAGTRLVHIVAADVSLGHVCALSTLLRQDNLARPAIVQVGPGTPAVVDMLPAMRIHAPLDIAPLRARTLDRRIRELLAQSGCSQTVLHAWSPAALTWAARLTGSARALVMQVESGDAPEPIARWFRSSSGRCRIAVITPTTLMHRKLRNAGIPAENCTLIRPAVDLDALSHVNRDQVRARLRIRPAETLVLALPPVTRHTGAFVTTWASLLLEKTRPDLRLVVPGGGREYERIAYLARACRHEHMVRLADERFSVPELVSAADLAVFLPDRDAPLAGVAWAMAAATPIIATDVLPMTELLQDGRNAWLCRPNDLQAAARRMLQALESGDKVREVVEAARAQASETFGVARLVAQYARVYTDLLSGRGACEGDVRTGKRFAVRELSGLLRRPQGADATS